MNNTDEILERLIEAGQSTGAFGGIGPSECRSVAAAFSALREQARGMDQKVMALEKDRLNLRSTLDLIRHRCPATRNPDDTNLLTFVCSEVAAEALNMKSGPGIVRAALSSQSSAEKAKTEGKAQ
jgi:hypothetical protein